MVELFLKFTDENGEERRVAVDKMEWIVGRHSSSDLHIADGRLSRQHLKIERRGDTFTATDAGSSNGSKLNNKPLLKAAALNKGDLLDLGGLTVFVEFDSDEELPEPEAAIPEEPDAENLSVLPENAVSVASQPQPANSSTSTLLLLLIPICGLIFLLFAGGVIYLLVSGSDTNVTKKQDDFIYTNDDADDSDDEPSKGTNTNSGTTNQKTETNSSSTPGTSDTSSGTNSAPPGNSSDTAKIEQNGGAFLRRIAHNDQRAFITGDNAQRLSAKIKQFSGSSAVAENLKSARKNTSQLTSLATSKNLKPQFLAIAAVARLGTTRGDVLQTAQSMTEVLDKLGTQIGTELADDAMLVIAAYGQGSAGDFMKMRNMLQDLSNKFPASTREIRTIWFLQKNGKITPAEFENALNFLAIGTISQNPKDFGVDAEALTL